MGAKIKMLAELRSWGPEGTLCFFAFYSFQRLPGWLGFGTLLPNVKCIAPPSTSIIPQPHPFLTIIRLPPSYKGPVITLCALGKSEVISLPQGPPLKVIYSPVLGIRMWKSLGGGHYSSHHTATCLDIDAALLSTTTNALELLQCRSSARCQTKEGVGGNRHHPTVCHTSEAHASKSP